MASSERGDDDAWFGHNRSLFKKARGDVGRGFRHHETMREGAPLRRITIGYNAAAAGAKNKHQISRRNYKKFVSHFFVNSEQIGDLRSKSSLAIII